MPDRNKDKTGITSSTQHEQEAQPDSGGPLLLDVNQVAALLNCSPRHVYRLSQAGELPRPRKLGALVRWSRPAIERFAAGPVQDENQGR